MKLILLTLVKILLMDKLCDGYFSKCDHYKKHEDKGCKEKNAVILLQSPNDAVHAGLNERLCEYAEKNLLTRFYIFEDNHVFTLNTTLNWNSLQCRKNVINLKVPDFYTINLNSYFNVVEKRGYEFVREINEADYNYTRTSREVCVILPSDGVEIYNDTRPSREVWVTLPSDRAKICNDTRSRSEKVEPITVLASKDVVKNKLLLRAMLDFTKSEIFKNPPSVLICGDNVENVENNGGIGSFNINNATIMNCGNKIEELTKKSSKLLAVLAEKPFEYETEVPVVFSNIKYDLPHYRDYYPNGIYPSIVTKRALKFVFLELLKHYEWGRVGIVSDDSAYSEEFRQQLRELFIMNEITFTEKNCVGFNCNFESALEHMRNTTTMIIIANVDEENLSKLGSAAVKLDMTNPSYVWLVRDWRDHSILSKNTGEVFSITLDTLENKFLIDTVHVYLNSLYTSRTVKTHEEINRELKKYLEDAISTKIQSVTGVIWKMSASSSPYARFDMSADGLNPRFSFGDVAADVPTDVPDCSFKEKGQCVDHTIILFIAVTTMFLLTLFVIIVFFYEFFENTNGYNNLYE